MCIRDRHGASENRFGTSIQINLQLSKGWLHFEIQNSKSDDKTILVPGDGLGLKNVKRQLELTYPDHQLIIDTTYGLFSVSLVINLNEN